LYKVRSERQARKEALQAGKKPYGLKTGKNKLRLKRRQEKPHRQPKKDSQAGQKRLIGGQEMTQRQARIDSKAGKKTLKGRQENTQRQARQH
jgi:hypothetical protein